MLTIKSSQKLFTEDEVSGLTGICLDHLRNFARSRHLGFIARAAEAAGADIIEGPVARQGARRIDASSVYVRDPDGNLLEFMIYPPDVA